MLCRAKQNSGFTLVELLVVVAIAGILSSLAISNYQKNVRKAYQSEAKLALAAIYSAEKAFASEYSAYISDFGLIGFTPEGYKRNYSEGFDSCQLSGSVTGVTASSGVCRYMRVNTSIPSHAGCNPDTNTVFAGCGPDSGVVDSQTFMVGAAALLRENGSCDYWRINEYKQLMHVTNGL